MKQASSSGSSSPLPSASELTLLAQTMGRFLALIYTSVQTKELFRLMKERACTVEGRLSKPPSATALRAALTALTEQHVVTEETLLERVMIEPTRAHALCKEAAASGHLELWIDAIRMVVPLFQHRHRFELLNDPLPAVRDTRLELYRGQMGAAAKRVEQLIPSLEKGGRLERALQEIFFNPYDAPWLLRLPTALLLRVLECLVDHAEKSLHVTPGLTPLLSALLEREKEAAPPELYWLAARRALVHGQPDHALTLATSAGPQQLELTGVVQFMKGAFASAASSFEALLAQARKKSKKKVLRLSPLAEPAYLLTLKALGTPEHLAAGKDYLEKIGPALKTPHDTLSCGLLDVIFARLQLDELLSNQESLVWRDGQSGDYGAVTLVLFHAVLYLRGKPLSPAQLEYLRRLEAHTRANGEHWMEAECAQLLGQETQDSAALARAEGLRTQGGFQSFLAIFKRSEAWEGVLADLASIGETERAAVEPSTRLLWTLSRRRQSLFLVPKEQRPLASGEWNAGRYLSVRRVFLDWRKGDRNLPPCDQPVMEALSELERIEEGEFEITPECQDVLLALVGHPNVAWADTPTKPLRIVQRVPELKVTPGSTGITLELVPFANKSCTIMAQEHDAQIEVISMSEAQLKIAKLVGQAGLTLPSSAIQRARDVLAAITNLIPVDTRALEASLNQVPASSLPVMLLVPRGERLELSLVVRPQGPGTPAFAPGEGPERVYGTNAGGTVLFVRNKAEEQARADQVVAAIPSLHSSLTPRGPWVMVDPELSLTTLQALNDLGEAVALEWPKGGAFRVTRDIGPSNLRVRIQGQGGWFDASGSLTLEDGSTIEMLTLIQLIENAKTRFIRLDEDRYLALTDALRRSLETMRGLLMPGEAWLRIHPLAAQALEESLPGTVAIDADRQWQEQLKKIRSAQQLTPEVPPDFRAALRPYQHEGFCWMARLAHWGAGACLADDMGLGKTIQALALLCQRGEGGPALVLAPTSVCPNWIEEARTFAPSLTPILFGPGDRSACIEQLGPKNLLICTYGLLLQEQELLTQRRWHTVILDEAQAIKNVSAKRSQAVLQLQADFRLITTGTPIENHLGELWTLFRFLNPGLLGSMESFNRRFAGPIERDKDSSAQEALRRLLQPFILRRKKADVLAELPSRTEILIHVEPSSQEQALYEALRQRAVEAINDPSISPVQRRFRILTEIMRLRRAACNPKLVLPEQEITSSKLAELETILEELLENRHKALIFSQFVDHLALIQGLVEKMGIPFQYLDGSTPQAERKQRIAAFQAGQGEVFLISLKAGGVGINLTAADYVIHMDPWWNPAVEDQASDRAHRMGQKRPVTVYRLVSRGSIEDKIVALHQQKRGLADSLLEGTDASGKLSEDELLALLTQEGSGGR